MKGEFILETDEKAATKVNLDLWQSTRGNLFKEEKDARYDSATHTKCEKCTESAEKPYRLCGIHLKESAQERWGKMPRKGWDKKTPLVIFQSEQYFFDEYEIEDYCDENDIDSSELQLVICDPIHMRQIDEDYWTDCIPEESDFPKGFLSELKKFNEYIESLPLVGWGQGSFRTEYKSEVAK